MDIFDYALKMEKDGENFYREIAEQTNNPGIQTIVTMLADEEVKHYQAIERMKQDRTEPMSPSKLLNEARNVFVQMKEQEQTLSADMGEKALYEKARQIEKQSREFYQEKADQAERDDQKGLFAQLASEEQKHFLLLQNIIDFISRPEQWLENAEWHHLEAY